MVISDRILLNQLLQNLIGNALKYTEKGFVKVTETSDADGLLLCIEDSGSGIPSDKLERIFDEYYQVDQSGTQRSGVGLGLAIVREVSRLLSYSVSVSSEVGRGTQVRVRIPLEQVGSDAPPVEEPHPLVTAPHATSTRLVLLEDNDAVRAATELFLTLEGYRDPQRREHWRCRRIACQSQAGRLADLGLSFKWRADRFRRSAAGPRATSMGSAGHSLERRFAVDDARGENINCALSILK